MIPDIGPFTDRVTYYQHLFGLDNWQISIQEGKEEGNHSAKTIADPRYAKALMTVYPKFLESKVWDETIIHELIHVIMSEYDFYVDNLGHEIKNEKGEIITDELFFIARERAVSELTTVIIRLIKNAPNKVQEQKGV